MRLGLSSRIVLGLAGFLGIVTGAIAEQAKSLGDLTGPWQLFVDDYVVAEKSAVSRTYHPFEKHPDNPLFVGDKPWENGDIYLYGTVLPTEDGTGYRMWYQALPFKEGEPNAILYAESKDGLTWTKPNLGIFSRQGSTDNNIVFEDPEGSFMASVMHTPWDPDPDRKYKVIRMGEHGGLQGAYSPDGIHMTPIPDGKFCPHGGDSVQAMWDPHTKQYVGYGKVIHNVDGTRRRCVGRAATANFENWPQKMDLIITPDTIDDHWVEGLSVSRTHLYGVSAFAYESMYIGILWIFRATDEEGYLVGPLFCDLVTSRDGIHWLREEGDRPPVLPLGAPGSWDDGMTLSPNAPIVVGDELWLYYGGFDEEHSCPMHGKIGLATMRKDGFASLDAKGTQGTVLTKRLAGAKGALLVNYAAPDGTIKVEVLDAAGKVIPGYEAGHCRPLAGDSVKAAVVWKDHTELPAGPIRLRFLVENASLYSFAAGDEVEVLDEPAGPTLAALYTFETDGGKSATDQLAKDGKQSVSFVGMFRVNSEQENVAFGERAMAIGSQFCPYNTMRIEGTRQLGTRFTLALMAKSQDNKHARLFSSFAECGSPKLNDLVFDCDPNGSAIPGLRLIVKGVESRSTQLDFADGKYHHLAVTYDDGQIAFYLDGKPAGQGRVPGGAPVRLKQDLFVGEDAALGSHEQLSGHLDDVLVLGRALSAEEIKKLSKVGAEKFFNGRL